MSWASAFPGHRRGACGGAGLVGGGARARRRAAAADRLRAGHAGPLSRRPTAALPPALYHHAHPHGPRRRAWSGCSSSSGSTRTCAASTRVFAHAELVPWLQARRGRLSRRAGRGRRELLGGLPAGAVLARVLAGRAVVRRVRHAPPSCPVRRMAWRCDGSFVYTGDTRPIPEMLAAHARRTAS